MTTRRALRLGAKPGAAAGIRALRARPGPRRPWPWRTRRATEREPVAIRSRALGRLPIRGRSRSASSRTREGLIASPASPPAEPAQAQNRRFAPALGDVEKGQQYQGVSLSWRQPPVFALCTYEALDARNTGATAKSRIGQSEEARRAQPVMSLE